MTVAERRFRRTKDSADQAVSCGDICRGYVGLRGPISKSLFISYVILPQSDRHLETISTCRVVEKFTGNMLGYQGLSVSPYSCPTFFLPQSDHHTIRGDFEPLKIPLIGCHVV